MNNKGYNNFDAWDKIENKSPTTIIINNDANNDANNEDGIDDASFHQMIDETDYDEVLELSQYTESTVVSNNDKDYSIAEYNNIDTTEITKEYTINAKKFVNQVTQFVKKFGDIELTQEHEAYIETVGKTQIMQLQDLYYLREVNKQMMDNIIARVNVTMAEDYAVIASYTNLANQHIKLLKDLNNTVKNIPSVIKRLRTDVMCDQQLGDGGPESSDDLQSLDENQYTNSKQMLKQILAKRALEKENFNSEIKTE